MSYQETYNKNFLERDRKYEFSYKSNFIPLNGKLEVFCSHHNTKFFMETRGFTKRGYIGCKGCKIKKVKIDQIDLYYSKWGDKIKKYNLQYTIDPSNKFKTVHDKIDFYCKRHNVIFSGTMNNFVHQGCINCHKCNKEKQILELTEKCNKLNKLSHYKIIDIISNSKIKVKCNLHNTYHISNKQKFIKGSNVCKKCREENGRNETLNKIERKFNIIFDVDGEYETYKTKVLNFCKDHNVYFRSHLKNFLRGSNSCPKCKCNSSEGEKEISKLIRDLNFKIIQNDRRLIYPMELDILIPEKKLAIEFNGVYWHSNNKKDKNYHSKKQNLVESKNYKLIQIWDEEWSKNKNVIKEIILYHLGIKKSPLNNLHYCGNLTLERRFFSKSDLNKRKFETISPKSLKIDRSVVTNSGYFRII